MLRLTEEERKRIRTEAKQQNMTVTDLLIGPWRTSEDDR